MQDIFAHLCEWHLFGRVTICSHDFLAQDRTDVFVSCNHTALDLTDACKIFCDTLIEPQVFAHLRVDIVEVAYFLTVQTQRSKNVKELMDTHIGHLIEDHIIAKIRQIIHGAVAVF